jgi:hypothetical protein
MNIYVKQRTNISKASQADSAEGKLGSDPFEEIKLEDELSVQVLNRLYRIWRNLYLPKAAQSTH